MYDLLASRLSCSREKVSLSLAQLGSEILPELEVYDYFGVNTKSDTYF